jgi:hypothetical protein
MLFTLQLLPKGKEGGKRLLYWYLEDTLKRRYNMMVTALEECTRDNLDFIKEKATKVRQVSERNGWIRRVYSHLGLFGHIHTNMHLDTLLPSTTDSIVLN